jgi:purine-nucleoside phosphorylase
MSPSIPSPLFAQAESAIFYLRPLLPEALQRPRIAVICGSGLGGLADALDEKSERCEFEYGDIPHFPVSTGE